MIDGNTPIWQLTVDQYKELIQSLLPKTKLEIEENHYFNSKEAREYLKVSSSTLNRWTKENYLKSEKFGGIRRYRKSECDKVLNSNRQD